jgi:hypothetical protein
MRVLLEPEHIELCLVPAADEVEAEAAPTDVIGRDDLLRREYRRKERHMHSTEHSEALGGGQQATGPGDGLKRAALEIGCTAIALPPPDRHQAFEAGRVYHLGEPNILREGVLPALRHCGRGAAARAVGVEDGKLEPIAAKHGRIALDIHECALTSRLSPLPVPRPAPQGTPECPTLAQLGPPVQLPSTKRAALAAIPGYDNYDTWLKTGMALHSTGESWARPLWDGWSAQSDKYDARVQADKWRSFHQDGHVHIGILLTEAHNHGWRRQPAVTGNGTTPRAGVEDGPSSAVWPEPIPLPDDLPSVREFDFDLLPARLRSWTEDICERMQCPPDYVGSATMTALSAALGRRVGLRPQAQTDWTVIANLWGLVIGRPGLLKSPAVRPRSSTRRP